MRSNIILCIFIIIFSSIAFIGIKYQENFGNVEEKVINYMNSTLSGLDNGNVLAPKISSSDKINIGKDIILNPNGQINANNIKANGTMTSQSVQSNNIQANNINSNGTVTANALNADTLCLNGECLTTNQFKQLIAISSNDANQAINNPTREYPPIGIPRGKEWRKDMSDQIKGIERNYCKYKVTATNVAYGNGEYVAWANSIWDYQDGPGFNNNEWAPSGAFDKMSGVGVENPVWHIHHSSRFVNSNNDLINPFILNIKLPQKILLRYYSLQVRTDCCPEQIPSKWVIEGSNDGNVWKQIDIQTGVLNLKLGETHTFNLVNIPTTLYDT